MDAYAGFEPQVGEIRAVRTFRVGPGGVLYPLFDTVPWADGANTARCRALLAVDGAHPVPEPDCSCGFYAYGSEQAASEYPHARHVLAVIACWGRVIAGTRGVRVEYGRIEALWLSDAVPAGLAASVAKHYPAVALYHDRAAMLAENPPTPLDCYELDRPRQRTGTRRWLYTAVAFAVLVSVFPADWWGSIQDARVVWAGTLAVFVLAAVLLSRGNSAELTTRRQRVLFQAVALWLVAPFAGPIGALLLRIPLVQLTVLILLQRYQLRQAASHFPADIS